MFSKQIALRLVLLIPLLLVALEACKGPASEQGPSQAVLQQDPRYIIGAGIYDRSCAGCHGDKGEGRESLGPQINTPDWQQGHTDAQIRDSILNGGKEPGTSMDGFKGALTDDEIADVIVYIRTLRP